MSYITQDWQFVEQSIVEPDVIAAARERADEFGIPTPSVATGATMATLAKLVDATNAVEIGASGGVSALWIRQGSPNATLTTIEPELDHVEAAKAALKDAGVPSNRSRFIPGKPNEALPKLADQTYDYVVLDAAGELNIEMFEESLRISRTGGVILVIHALGEGKVSNPAKRDDHTSVLRSIIDGIAEIPGATSTLLPVGDGVLVIAH